MTVVARYLIDQSLIAKRPMNEPLERGSLELPIWVKYRQGEGALLSGNSIEFIGRRSFHQLLDGW